MFGASNRTQCNIGRRAFVTRIRCQNDVDKTTVRRSRSCKDTDHDHHKALVHDERYTGSDEGTKLQHHRHANSLVTHNEAAKSCLRELVARTLQSTNDLEEQIKVRRTTADAIKQDGATDQETFWSSIR